MKNKINKNMAFTFVIVLILVVVASLIVIDMNSNNRREVMLEEYFTEQEIYQQQIEDIIDNREEMNEVLLSIIKSDFNDRTESEKVDLVDKMYFSTCTQVEDFCADAKYSDLTGCEYCESK